MPYTLDLQLCTISGQDHPGLPGAPLLAEAAESSDSEDNQYGGSILILEVPRKRTEVVWGLYWGPLILGDYTMQRDMSYTSLNSA